MRKAGNNITEQHKTPSNDIFSNFFFLVTFTTNVIGFRPICQLFLKFISVIGIDKCWLSRDFPRYICKRLINPHFFHTG